MTELNPAEIEQRIGSEADQFVYRVPKKNHDLTLQLGKDFGDIVTSYGVTHLVFQLNNTEAPMEGYQHSQDCFSYPTRGGLVGANVLQRWQASGGGPHKNAKR